MGEYLNLPNGDSYKLGTCESLYYARRDEIEKALPRYPELREYLKPIFRYRFPWPEEDGHLLMQRPPHYNEPFKTHGFNCSLPPEQAEHEDVTFNTSNLQRSNKDTGYQFNIWIPCPNADNTKFNLKSNPRHARYLIIAQKYTDQGEPITVCACDYCGAMFRLTAKSAELVRQAILDQESRADKDNPHSWYKLLAERIHGEPEEL